jgi:hypothetical protein
LASLKKSKYLECLNQILHRLEFLTNSNISERVDKRDVNQRIKPEQNQRIKPEQNQRIKPEQNQRIKPEQNQKQY